MTYSKLLKVKKIFKKELYNFFYILCSLIFFVIDIFYPKKKNLIVFSQKHNLFSDNSRAFFEYINLNEKDYEAVWLASDETGKNKIINFNKDFKVKNIKSLDAIITLLKAKTVIVSNSLHDFFPYFKTSFRKETVQLWHGIKWLKQYEYPNNNFTNDLTIICSSSEEHRSLMSKHNLIDIKKIYITGFSRNDIFFNSKKEDLKKKLPSKVLNNFQNKIILYTPTHKEELNAVFFPFDDVDLDKLNFFLVENKITIYLRPHINDSNKSKLEWKSYFKNLNQSNIKDLTFTELEDINLLLPFTNIIVTDYSAIYTDAMLLNIPMIFIPYDLDDYTKKRGLIYNYDDVAAGHKVFDQSHFLKSIDEIINGKNIYNTRLNQVKKIFHSYEDGKSSERIMSIIKKKLNN